MWHNNFSLRTLAHILLVTILLLNTFEATLIWSIFEYNKDFIAQNLCRNQNEPQLMCSGKCVLSDQLAEAQESGEDLPFDWSETHHQEYPLIAIHLIDYELVVRPTQWPTYSALWYSDSHINGIFRPPIAA